jgi:hypothetical protein
MCFVLAGQPYRLTVARRRVPNSSPIEVYTYVLGKVTQFRRGSHTSLRGFTYPIGRFVHDANAIVGDHVNGLHFIAAVAGSKDVDSFGSHRLAVLPAPQLWDPPVENGASQERCWHSSGATTLFCLDCAGYTPTELTNPVFWDALTKPLRRPNTQQKVKNNDFVLRLPRNAVWYKQTAVRSNGQASAWKAK